jgi:hypothetical protein
MQDYFKKWVVVYDSLPDRAKTTNSVQQQQRLAAVLDWSSGTDHNKPNLSSCMNSTNKPSNEQVGMQQLY